MMIRKGKIGEEGPPRDDLRNLNAEALDLTIISTRRAILIGFNP